MRVRTIAQCGCHIRALHCATGNQARPRASQHGEHRNHQGHSNENNEKIVTADLVVADSETGDRC